MSESLKGYVCEASVMKKSNVGGVKKPKYLCYKNRTKQKTLISCEKRVR